MKKAIIAAFRARGIEPSAEQIDRARAIAWCDCTTAQIAVETFLKETRK